MLRLFLGLATKPEPPSGDVYVGVIKFNTTSELERQILANLSDVETEVTEEFEKMLKSLVPSSNRFVFLPRFCHILFGLDRN